MAILLASVPELTFLSAHVSQSDPFLGIPLRNTLVQPSLLRELQQLYRMEIATLVPRPKMNSFYIGLEPRRIT